MKLLYIFMIFISSIALADENILKGAKSKKNIEEKLSFKDKKRENIEEKSSFKKVDLRKINKNNVKSDSGMKYFILAYVSFFVLLFIYILIMFNRIKKLEKELKQIKLIMEKDND